LLARSLKASVYDNEHGVAKNAGHLDIMLNYVNPGTVSPCFRFLMRPLSLA
jgi:hypothetical protein